MSLLGPFLMMPLLIVHFLEFCIDFGVCNKRNSLQGLSHWHGGFVEFQFHLSVFQIASSSEELAVFGDICVNLKIIMLHFLRLTLKRRFF